MLYETMLLEQCTRLQQDTPTDLGQRLDNWEREIEVFGADAHISYDTDDFSIRVKTPAFDVYLFLHTNEMAILSVTATKTQRGTDILHQLHLAAAKLGIARIELCDTSTIHDGNIRLAYYHILLHGISWYNSMGYKGAGFEEDTKYNQAQIERRVEDVIHPTIDILLLDDLLLLADFRKKTVREAVQALDRFVRRGSEDIRIYALIEYFIGQLGLRYNPLICKSIVYK
jgi:hypothetical protein